MYRNLKQHIALFLFISLFVSGLWASFGRFWPLLAPLFFLAYLIENKFRNWGPLETEPQLLQPSSRESQIVTIIVMSPALAYLFCTWNQEFPFMGDHDHHISQAFFAFHFWLIWIIPGYFLGRWFLKQNQKLDEVASPAFSAKELPQFLRSKGFLTFTFLFFLIGSILNYGLHPDMMFSARYPGSGYLFAFPWLAIARIFNWEYPINALRLSSTMGIFIWLWWLRPHIIGRKPDLSILPFAAFFYFQKDVLYYFTSAYLEPWAIIFILLACERLLVFGKINYWKIFLLLGFAAVIKEQTILLVPFFAFAVFPWKGPRTEQIKSLQLLICSLVPFICYYALRTIKRVWRGAGLAPMEQILDPHRREEFIFRFFTQWDNAWILCVLVLFLILAIFVFQKQRRLALFSMGAALVFHVLFFYADAISQFWTGYVRFQLIPLALFACPLIYLGDLVRHRRQKILLFSLTLFMAAFNLSVLLPDLKVAVSEKSYARNTTEHYDTAIYLAIAESIKKAASENLIKDITKLKLVEMFSPAYDGYSLWLLKYAYPHLEQKFKVTQLRNDKLPKGEATFCKCTDSEELVLAPFIIFKNFALLTIPTEHIQRHKADAETCIQSLKATCKIVSVLEDKGNILSAMGRM